MDRHLPRKHLHIAIIFIMVAVLTFSCVLPGVSTPGPQPTPTTYQEPLPPVLAEVSPPDGSQIGLNQSITFYFGQPMERSSVESALFGLPSGSLSWEDDATLVFTPDPSYEAGAELTVAILSSAQAANGLSLAEPVTLTFTTSAPLKGLSFLPEPNSQDIDPNAAVAVTFNQPVVPLGQLENLPDAFVLDPTVEGRGEWLSTSTYIFYPEPALAGGVTYRALLNPELVSTSGASLGKAGDSLEWSFETALPRLVSLEPSSETPLGLEPEFTLTFNQAMDTGGVETGFSLRRGDRTLPGTFEWTEDHATVTFLPDERLERGTEYTLTLSNQARAVSGTPLAIEQQVQFFTYGDFKVSGSVPQEGTVKKENASVRIFFSSPVAGDQDLEEAISVTPEVPGLQVSLNGTAVNLHGFYDPETTYSVIISPTLLDRWGQPLNATYRLNFRTPPVAPNLSMPYNGVALFVRPEESLLYASAVNVTRVDVSIASLTLGEFQTLVGPGGHDARRTFVLQNPSSFSQTYRLPPSRNETITLPLAAPGQQLAPGLYYVRATSPQLLEGVGDAQGALDYGIGHQPGGGQVAYSLVVSSYINLTFKAGSTDALIWAIDLRTNSPVADAPVAVYDTEGVLLASGTTDDQGIWQGEFEPPENAYGAMLAILSEPGQETFGLAFSSWNTGVSPWEFGLSYSKQPPHTETYLYTDRPIYRPGQTVYFRGVVRQAFNGRYELPPFPSLALELRDQAGLTLQTFDLPISPYGTVHGEYELSAEAPPGVYRLFNNDLEASIYFEVAEYRKPEFELQLSLDESRLSLDGQLHAQAQANYYFGSPASGLDVHWVLYDFSSFFSLPGYQTGVFDDSWLQPYWRRGYPFGRTLDNGIARTGKDGSLELDFPELPESESPQRLTLELTAQDESGFPVSAQAEAVIHPADFYIGVRPDQWIGQSGKAIGFEVFTADWDREASPSRDLRAEFKQVHWERVDAPSGWLFESPTYEPVYSQVTSSDLSTGPDGKARLSFTPKDPGTYILDVSGQGARTQILLWVGGQGTATWPRLLNDRLRLTADQKSYQPGQDATIFIPNPFGEPIRALLTVERGKVMQAEVLTLDAAGTSYSLALGTEDAPNVFISATLLGPENQFRQGYLDIEVDPAAQELQVEVTAEPEISQPRGEITLSLQVSDDQGNPVEGEFSLSIVDKAVLALADPNSADIMSAFYGRQPLGVDTSLSLAAYSGRYLSQPPGGMGGGGGEEIPFVREQFPDTAYWNPTFTTDAQGQARVMISLPDNLTTWLIETRGLTQDTRVGQAESEVVTTKPLLVRPVTPRFMVLGDHVEMAAIVHNNTAADVQVTVGLKAEGFTLDQPDEATRTVTVPANDRLRVTWWGTAEEGVEADLTFSANGRSAGAALQDAAKPALGPIPILTYSAPHTFVTSGMLAEAGSRLEVISLPHSFAPLGGGLEVEMTGSLAGTLLESLKALPVPSCFCNNEAVLSYLLPNLETYQALQASGLHIPELQERLDANVKDSLTALIGNQNVDGGWGWIHGGRSDGYLSAYVLFGLSQARQAGSSIPDRIFERAHEYIRENELAGVSIKALQPWQLDRLVFTVFALQQSGGLTREDGSVLDDLYDRRDVLSPWAQALLALVLEDASTGDARARDLISNLEASAVRTASSANWESGTGSWRNPGTPLYTTAVVVYALAQRDPAAPILIEAVRYLVANRGANSLWGSTYESAWVILALTQAMQGFGELQADFSFSAEVNGAPLASGEARGTQILNPIQASVPLEYLSADSPNALTFEHDEGLGRLYYRAALLLDQPVASAQPLSRGIQVSRAYFDGNCQQDCAPLTTFGTTPGSRLTARLTFTLQNDSYYVVLDDFIPAGMELLNRTLKTSQQGENTTEAQVVVDDEHPYSQGWGWWYFNQPQLHDDRISWMADYLPAGTYELTYTLLPTSAGEFHVLPAHAWLAFFPDVQGTSAGTVFEIKP